MPSPASRCWFLVVSAALFAAWIGYLAYLVLETARPTIQFWPPRITKTQPIILSRPQFLVSTLDVIADVQQDDGRPDAVMRIESVHWPADERDRFAHRTITVSNLAGCAGW